VRVDGGPALPQKQPLAVAHQRATFVSAHVPLLALSNCDSSVDSYP
jgi:hypothetical protein